MSKLKVRDLMTTQVVTLRPDENVKKAVIKFALDNISGAPVVDNRNHLLGILSENDILNLIMDYQNTLDNEKSDSEMLSYSMDSSSETDERLRRISDEISNKPVSEVMTRTVLTTTPDASIMEVLRSMIDMKVNRLPVVEKGVLVGIITRGDIIFALYKRKVRGRRMLEVHVLASGSDGNCTVIESDGEAIMIDAGVSCRKILEQMEREGVDRSMVKAILITHEHSDHVSGAGATARKLGVPVMCNEATFSMLSLGNVDYIPFDPNGSFDVGQFHVTPLPTSHNAVQPNAFYTRVDDKKVLLATDTGKLTFQIEAALREADIAVIEANYDNRMLIDGPYPYALKKLIGSDRGHMCNVDTGDAIRRTMTEARRQIFLAHLSRTNNEPDIARETVAQITGIRRLNIDCLEFPGDSRTLRA